ncbi:MAG: CPBP family glutamic-type intramembrane protease, partial [Candidatus Limnocylindrales bacterium]
PGPLLVAHAAPFGPWAAVTILVAVAEEVVLRGAFFAALGPVVGPLGPLGVAFLAALAFALIHVPLEGWSIMPLDIGAGLWLGGLRLLSGGVTAPAAAHAVADLATWRL